MTFLFVRFYLFAVRSFAVRVRVKEQANIKTASNERTNNERNTSNERTERGTAMAAAFMDNEKPYLKKEPRAAPLFSKPIASAKEKSYLCNVERREQAKPAERIDAVANANRRSSPRDWSQCAMRLLA